MGERYAVVHPLGSGGVSETFEGRDEQTGERVVIRRVDLRAVDAATRALLYHQAALLQRYQGDGRLLDLQTAPERIVIVTQWVVGVPLSQLETRQSPLQLAEALFTALATFHDQKLLHLDLKPDNIIVKPDGSIALIDFGMGGTLAASPVGTARYMSPEQAGTIRRDIGPAADLYSAGRKA